MSFFMDFGVVGFDGLVGSGTAACLASDPETKQKLYGSGVCNKQEISGFSECDFWRSSKLPRTDDDFSASNKSLLRSNGSPLFPGCEEPPQMLSFSKPEALNATLSYSNLTSSTPYSRNTGHNSGICNGEANMQFGVLSGTKVPFTQSQWIELHHQALIYKYINSNAVIPSYLLQPIRKAFESAGFSGGLLRSSSLGWGGFHLGFSGSMDPEPRRCRRTDGKKWRCSRDAVADQKYCERHMNRGRHRSRKPVEAPSVPGHSITSSTTTTLKAASSVPLNALSSAAQPATIDRMFMNKEDTSKKFQTLNSKENPFLISSPFQEPSHGEFRLVSSDSLVNPSLKKPSSLTTLGDQETESNQPLLHLMDRDQPSMSKSDNVTLSPLRVSHVFDPIQMGLGVVGVEEPSESQANWIPHSYEISLGGPLGEVLNKNITKSGSAHHEQRSAGLELLNETWDRSTQSSPTGVLQKTTFVSLSNSSTASSPRAENHASNSYKVHEGTSFHNDMFLSTL